ncbi:hypothetical protein BMIN10S_00693 [Bosea minatitlanensis]
MVSTAPLSARRCCRRLRGENRFGSDDRRHEGRQRLCGLARLPALSEQLLRRQAMPTRHLRDDRSGNQRLFKNLCPVIGTPPPSTYRPGDHLEAAHLALKLKSVVKPRHKTILQIRIVRVRAQPAAKKVGSEQRLHGSRPSARTKPHRTGRACASGSRNRPSIVSQRQPAGIVVINRAEALPGNSSRSGATAWPEDDPDRRSGSSRALNRSVCPLSRRSFGASILRPCCVPAMEPRPHPESNLPGIRRLTLQVRGERILKYLKKFDAISGS